MTQSAIRAQETLIFTIIIRMLGNILYALIGGLPLDHADKVTLVVAFYAASWLTTCRVQFDVLIASRLIVGFGAGSMAVCNAYITGATTLEERTAWIGLLAGTGVCALPVRFNSETGALILRRLGTWLHCWTSDRKLLWKDAISQCQCWRRVRLQPMHRHEIQEPRRLSLLTSAG